MSSRGTILRTLTSLATGCLFVLAIPRTGAWWLAFGAWVPLLWAVDGQSVRRAAFYGLVAGASMTCFGFYWMTELLARFAKLPAVPAHIVLGLFSALQGAQWAAFGGLLAWLQRRTGRSVLLLTPPAWVVGEAFAPHIFPTYAALAWCDQPLLLQIAELGGVTMVGAVQLMINAAIYSLLRSPRGSESQRGSGSQRGSQSPRRSRAPALTLLCVAVFLPAFGAWRMKAADTLAAASPTARIGVVQGNHGIREWSSRATRADVLARIQAETARVETKGVDFLLWGENVHPYRKSLAHVGGRDFEPWSPERIRVGFSAPLVFGAVTAEPPSDGPVGSENPFGWNSAIVLNPDGSFGDVYDKNYPLLFGEAAPFVDPVWYVKTVKGASQVNAGTDVVVLRVGAWRLGPLICYEDILPRFVRRVTAADVHLFVNLTSDTWFGASAEQAEHLGLAVLRTIEHRRGMVRSANTGVSAIVDPAGRVVLRTEVTDPDVTGIVPPVSFVAEVPMIDPAYRTPYARFGEWFPAAAGLFLTAVGIRGRRR
ncbi:MAG: apolipoprotein N-acyltransferase [Myxococcales bacterium]|nr:apolipoprotein N-acyltransferase [Myxococcales bacterium]